MSLSILYCLPARARQDSVREFVSWIDYPEPIRKQMRLAYIKYRGPRGGTGLPAWFARVLAMDEVLPNALEKRRLVPPVRPWMPIHQWRALDARGIAHPETGITTPTQYVRPWIKRRLRYGFLRRRGENVEETL